MDLLLKNKKRLQNPELASSLLPCGFQPSPKFPQTTRGCDRESSKTQRGFHQTSQHFAPPHRAVLSLSSPHSMWPWRAVSKHGPWWGGHCFQLLGCLNMGRCSFCSLWFGSQCISLSSRQSCLVQELMKIFHMV